MFKKAASLLIFISLILLSFPSAISAADEFITDSEINYQVMPSGKTLVTQKITLENAFTDLYAVSYKVDYENLEVVNPRAYEGNKNLDLSVNRKDKNTEIEVNFSDALVGKGNKRNFTLEFENPTFVQKTGEVWEISIPKLANPEGYRNFILSVSVPKSFGNEAYISPEADETSSDSDNRYYKFGKEKVGKTGIMAGFGDFQVFSFTLYYHLENPLIKDAVTEIAIPPDTATQKLYYQLMDPKPADIRIDQDGNWIAKYYLKPRERIDVKTVGSVQIFAGTRPFPSASDEVLNMNLTSSDYWQTGDPEIVKLAKELKTPKNIYDYVTGKLSYNYKRVEPNSSRMGALLALKNPSDAICTEFTDLFIAISRAAGIPAREINGYAYTENPSIQPLSLVNDVLHAWPEYWDQSRRSWITIDPTWGSTTGGVDYFNKLDLRHFAFVIHGADATKPYPPGSYKLGTNPQKDVFVNFGQLTKDKDTKIKLEYVLQKGLPFTDSNLEVKVLNEGQTALYNKEIRVYFDDKEKDQESIEVILPFSSHTANIKIPYTLLGDKTPAYVTVRVDDQEIKVTTSKNRVIIYNLLSLCVLLLIVLIFILIKMGKIKITLFQRFAQNKYYVGKLFKQNRKDKDQQGKL